MLASFSVPKNRRITEKPPWFTNRITDGQIWRFEAKPDSPRTARRAGCMLLGKVPPGFEVKDITEILSSVPVPSPEEAEATGWRCRHWVFDALTVLVAADVIPKIPGSPSDVWETGSAFVEKKTHRAPVYETPLYTCNTSGEEIPSEIAPLKVG